MTAGMLLMMRPEQTTKIPVHWNHLNLSFIIGMERRAQKMMGDTRNIWKNPASFMKPSPMYPRDVPTISIKAAWKVDHMKLKRYTYQNTYWIQHQWVDGFSISINSIRIFSVDNIL